jgi:tetratricopeptide (TPR) repeat protein
VTVLDLTKTVQIKENDAALLHYSMGMKLALSVGVRPELNVEAQKSIYQAMMHFLLSAHLLTLDNRFELIRWPQRAIGLMHFKGGDYTRALKQWTRILDENDPFHLVVCCFYLGLIYSKLKEYKQSVEYFKRALMHTASLPSIFEAQSQL